MTLKLQIDAMGLVIFSLLVSRNQLHGYGTAAAGGLAFLQWVLAFLFAAVMNHFVWDPLGF